MSIILSDFRQKWGNEGNISIMKIRTALWVQATFQEMTSNGALDLSWSDQMKWRPQRPRCNQWSPHTIPDGDGDQEWSVTVILIPCARGYRGLSEWAGAQTWEGKWKWFGVKYQWCKMSLEESSTCKHDPDTMIVSQKFHSPQVSWECLQAWSSRRRSAWAARAPSTTSSSSACPPTSPGTPPASRYCHGESISVTTWLLLFSVQRVSDVPWWELHLLRPGRKNLL